MHVCRYVCMTMMYWAKFTPSQVGCRQDTPCSPAEPFRAIAALARISYSKSGKQARLGGIGSQQGEKTAPSRGLNRS